MSFWNNPQRFRCLGPLTLLVLSLLVWRFWPTPQPYYQGEPLAYWFNQLPTSYSFQFPENMTNSFGGYPNKAIFHSVGTNVYGYIFNDPLELKTQAVAAIRSMGTNALPFLFGKFVRQRSHAWELMGRVANKCGLERFFFSVFPDLRTEQSKATTALLALVPLPQQYLSQLQTLSTNSEERIAVAASWVLKINAEAQ